jgi:hypothetical protein
VSAPVRRGRWERVSFLRVVQSDRVFMDNEQMDPVNTMQIEGRAVAVLGELGLRAVRRSADSLTLVGQGVVERIYRVEVRSRMTAPVAGAIGAGQEEPTLVVAPFVPEPAAEILRERGLAFVDLAGNAFISGDGLLIDVRGRRPAKEAVPALSPGLRRPFTRSGAQVTFCLLAWPDLADWPVRGLADVSGAALGTVHAVLRDLQAGGYLVDGPSGRALVRGGDLLNRWAEAYALSLSPSLHLGHYRAADPLWWRSASRDLDSEGVDLGGEAAAGELDDHLRSVTAALYAAEIPVRLLAKHRCVQALAGEGNVTVRRRFWTVPEGEVPPEGALRLVPPVLVHADLLTSGEPRQREHAQRLRMRNDRLKYLDRS